jgi:hypothetical protein
MGANAVTTVPVYTAGEILTAADLNITNSGIPVFADSSARDAAFGGAGEKVLAEGQYAYLESTKQTLVYDGSSWVAVGASGLTLVTAQTFSAATSFSLPTATFSSTYANYKLIIDITAASTNCTFTMRMRASGTDDTSSAYNTMMTGVTTVGGGASLLGADTSSFPAGEINSTFPITALSMDVISPNLARFTDLMGTIVSSTGSSFFTCSGGMSFRGTTAFDSLSFIVGGGANITGDYRVYGYANS